MVKCTWTGICNKYCLATLSDRCDWKMRFTIFIILFFYVNNIFLYCSLPMQGGVYTLMTSPHTLLVMFFLCYLFQKLFSFSFNSLFLYHIFYIILFLLHFSLFSFLSLQLKPLQRIHSSIWTSHNVFSPVEQQMKGPLENGFIQLSILSGEYFESNSLHSQLLLQNIISSPPTSKMQFLLHLQLKGANLTFQGSYTIKTKNW